VVGSANLPEDGGRGCHLVKERVATWPRYFAAAKVGPLPGARRFTTFLAPPAIRKKPPDQENKMLGKLAPRSAAITIVGVALTSAAPAATLRTHGVIPLSHVYGDRIGSAQFGATSHFGQLGARLGSAYGGGYGSHLHGGWYSRGFGGTLDPGWGYRFGRDIGGF
jgi:hypothetical protein